MKDLKNFQSFEIENNESVEGGWCYACCGNYSRVSTNSQFSSLGSFSFGSFTSVRNNNSTGASIAIVQKPVQRPATNYWWLTK